jgi:HSP20 family protein
MTTQLAKFLDHNFFEPYDIMFKDLFNMNSFFLPVENIKASYPTDVYEDDDKLNIDIAVAGLDEKDIKIEEEEGILRVFYNKEEKYNSNEKTSKCYIQQSIARRSFNLAWKISDKKFDLKNINAEMNKGILKITIPKVEENLKTTINIIEINQKEKELKK